ncbi:MAG: sigma-70 family RNA polymerase sigma factor [Planctomycetes bacterium]|nr:sigma-70 family RNA polymerase sigma factor [Planctomycetota bacterium]
MVQGSSNSAFAKRLARARAASDLGEFGALIADFQHWLLLLARLEIDQGLRAKVDPADLVQEVLLQACRDRAQFRGATEAELAGWLRKILAHVLAHEVRKYKGTQKRDVELELAIDQNLERSSAHLRVQILDTGTSPSGRAIKEEEGILLARALARLPDDRREVIVLRSLKELPFEEVARRLGKSTGAVRMLWLRALSRLKDGVKAWNP